MVKVDVLFCFLQEINYLSLYIKALGGIAALIQNQLVGILYSPHAHAIPPRTMFSLWGNICQYQIFSSSFKTQTGVLSHLKRQPVCNQGLPYKYNDLAAGGIS